MIKRMHAKLFPRHFVRHSLATHLSGVFAALPRPLRLAAEGAKARIAATPAAEIRALMAAPRERGLLKLEPLTGRSDLEPTSYCARIPVRGVLVLGDASCPREELGVDATGLDEIAHALDVALADPSVTEIVLDVCSPGGTATGIMAIHAQITAGKKTKPIRAEVTGQAASAAYKLISPCTEIIAEESALIGAIGTYAVVEDSSKAFEAEGITVHVIRSAPHKGVGEPGAPVTDEQLAALQVVVDDLADLFVRAIADGRQMPVEEIAALATGEVWIAGKARERGLIDGIAGVELAEPTNEAPPISAPAPDANTTNAPIGAITEDETMEKDKNPVTPAAGSAGITELDRLRAELAASQAAEAKAKEDAEKQRAIAASFQDAQKKANQARITKALDDHAKAGTFAPAERPGLDKLSEKFVDDPTAFEEHLATRAAVAGKVTRSTPVGQTPPEPEAGAPDPAVIARVAELTGRKPEEVAANANVIAVSFDGSVVRKAVK